MIVKNEGLLSSAKLILVGEQPGCEEVIHNRPFIGPAGQELESCLTSANINRNECFLTNVIRDLDKPLKFYFQEIKERQKLVGYSLTDRAQLYVEQLGETLEKAKTNVVVAIGGVACYALTSRIGITNYRGSVLPSTLVKNKLVIPCLHPSTVIRGNYLNQRLIIFDLLRAKQIAENGFSPPVNNIIIEPSFFSVLKFLQKVKKEKQIIWFDIEVFNEEVSCISFTCEENEVMCIPFVAENGEDYFTLKQEFEIWQLITSILEDRTKLVGGQNIVFDSAFLFNRYGVKIPVTKNRVHDTMIAQKIIMPDYPKGLDFITSIHTNYVYYKEDGKRWFKVGGKWQQLWNYNCLDSLICQVSNKSLEGYLKKQKNEQTYERTRSIIGPLVFMMEHGIRVDMEGLRTFRNKLENELNEKQNQLNELVGYELNPNSPKQLIKFFYTEQGFKPFKGKGKTDVTTDETALKRIKINAIKTGNKKALEAIELVLNIRHLVKVCSTYLAEEKFDKQPDGSYRIKCSYDPVGTRYSRLSSSENIFGSGTNLQNWPHEIQQFLLGD